MTLHPKPAVGDLSAYAVPRLQTPVDLYLDGNEGVSPPDGLLSILAQTRGALLRRYPSTRALEVLLAEGLGVGPEQLIVTGGGDDALDRACRAMLEPGDALVLPTPSFEMIWRYAHLQGARILRPPWPGGPWPRAAVLASLDARTRCVAVVSPNNPTGAVATIADIEAVSEAAPDALILVDLAYVEFADEDPTKACLDLPNAVVFRTLSKAWGLAGLRVGYAVGQARVIGWLRAAGNPYPVSAASLVLASTWITEGQGAVEAFVSRVRAQRSELTGLLQRHGARPQPSQANFVFCRPPDALALWRDLGALGISIRAWPTDPVLADCVRITVPGEEAPFVRLLTALGEVL